jgi:outer membrane translocation and assembly module TamA
MNDTVNFLALIVSLALCGGLPGVSVGETSAVAHPSNHQASSAKRAIPSTDSRLNALRVSGTTRYTEKEILAASGLELGQNVAEGDFQEAVRRLGETGLFSAVAYTYSYSAAGTKVEIQLTDVDTKKLVPATFENFVWFTDAELVHQVQERVPLFRQELPAAGTLPDRVSDALQAILSEKQLPGHVDYVREGGENGGNPTAITYRVTDVDIQIRHCEFPGASPEQAEALATVARKLQGARYDRSLLATVVRLDFLPVFLQRGYLKAKFGPSEAKVVPKSADSTADVVVDAIFSTTPGSAFTTAAVAWKGNSVVKTDELRGLIHVPVGKPADAVRLATELGDVIRLYRSRGYMAAQVTSEPTIDDAKATVSYTLHVVEGDQYKMGELEIVGLDTQATAHLQNTWKLREGDPYDGTYAKRFVDSTNAMLPGGVSWNIDIHEAVNAKDKSVDVTLRYRPR